METGDNVKLRAFKNKEIVRRFVAFRGDRVLVCSETEYLVSIQENRKPECIAFLRGDLISTTTKSARRASD